MQTCLHESKSESRQAYSRNRAVTSYHPLRQFYRIKNIGKLVRSALKALATNTEDRLTIRSALGCMRACSRTAYRMHDARVASVSPWLSGRLCRRRCTRTTTSTSMSASTSTRASTRMETSIRASSSASPRLGLASALVLDSGRANLALIVASS